MTTKHVHWYLRMSVLVGLVLGAGVLGLHPVEADGVSAAQPESQSTSAESDANTDESQPGDDAAAGGAPPAAPPTPVAVDAARMESVTRYRRVTGEIQAQRRSIVAAQEDGIVLELPFDEGSSVSRGDVLARLDATLLEFERAESRARFDEAEASVAVREAELEQAESDLTALEEVAGLGGAKPKELRDARIAKQAANARLIVAQRAVDSAQAQLKRIDQRLADKEIVAPFDGVIIAKNTEIGQWVAKGGAVVEIIQTGKVDAVIDVPEELVNLISVGDAIEVDVTALAQPVTGTVRSIIPFGSDRARTYPVKIELDDQDQRIKPRMSSYVWVPTTNTMEALTIRKDAIMRGDTGAHVFTVRNGAAAIVPVSVEFSAGTDRAVVNGGLAPGESVVIEGNERLFPHAPVRIVNAGQTERASPSSSSSSN